MSVLKPLNSDNEFLQSFFDLETTTTTTQFFVEWWSDGRSFVVGLNVTKSHDNSEFFIWYSPSADPHIISSQKKENNWNYLIPNDLVRWVNNTSSSIWPLASILSLNASHLWGLRFCSVQAIAGFDHFGSFGSFRAFGAFAQLKIRLIAAWPLRSKETLYASVVEMASCFIVVIV